MRIWALVCLTRASVFVDFTRMDFIEFMLWDG